MMDQPKLTDLVSEERTRDEPVALARAARGMWSDSDPDACLAASRVRPTTLDHELVEAGDAGDEGAKAVTRFSGVNGTLLQEVVRRIRATARPEKIILFGSRARGDERWDSDLDLLIVIESDLPRHKRAVPFYTALSGMGIAKDIVVYTPAEVEDWKTASCSLVATVLREGRVLYENQP